MLVRHPRNSFIMSSSGTDASSTSTTCYEQEPFSTFKASVEILCTTSLWPSIPLKQITIERMRGGAYNRIIGITIPANTFEAPPEDRPTAEAYVLRIPRGKRTRIEQEIAILCLIRENTTIPVPELIRFDLTSNNPIDSKYSLQQKIPGVPLFDVYLKISQSERLSIVRQLAQILLDIHGLHSLTPGLPEAVKFENRKLVPEIKIVDFRIKTFIDFSGEILWGGMEDDAAKPKTMFRLFIDQFDAWQRFGQNCDRGEEEDQLMERFRKVTLEMKTLCLLPEMPYVLFHPDFAPQNIMVCKLDEDSECDSKPLTKLHSEPQDNHQTGWKITGILDWDGAAFVPYSVACTPPSWLWCDWNDDEEDEGILCKIPDDLEARERKELFDSIMCSSYTDHAYSDGHRFVRRLFEFAINGFTYSHRYADAEKFFNEWKDKVSEIAKEL